jgi:hypothetical protein
VENFMTDADRTKYLRLVLVLVAVFCLFGFYPLTIVWPSGWAWHTGQSEYLQTVAAALAFLMPRSHA